MFWPSGNCTDHLRRAACAASDSALRAFHVKRTHVDPGGSCDVNKGVRRVQKCTVGLLVRTNLARWVQPLPVSVDWLRPRDASAHNERHLEDGYLN